MLKRLNDFFLFIVEITLPFLGTITVKNACTVRTTHSYQLSQSELLTTCPFILMAYTMLEQSASLSHTV